MATMRALSCADDLPAIPAASRDSDKRCTFLEIPPEIRIMIYHHLFGSTYMLVERLPSSTVTTTTPNRPRDFSNQILQTCRMLRFEGMPILQQNITLIIAVRGGRRQQPRELSFGLEWKVSLRKIELWPCPRMELDLHSFPNLRELVLSNSCLRDDTETDDLLGSPKIQGHVAKRAEAFVVDVQRVADRYMPEWRSRAGVIFVVKFWLRRVGKDEVDYSRILVDARNLECLDVSSIWSVDRNRADYLSLSIMDGSPDKAVLCPY